MEKVAIIELNESALNLSVYKTNGNKGWLCFSKSESFSFGKEIESSELISPVTKVSVLNILKIYRKMIEEFAVTKITAVANNIVINARNYKGFFDEIYNNTGLNFIILSDEDYIKYLFNSVICSTDSTKGVFVSVSDYKTFIVKYNRRAIVASEVLPFGSVNAKTLGNDVEEISKKITEKFTNDAFAQTDEDIKFVGCGNSFISIGRIAKKIERYPLDVDNNYVLSKQTMTKTFDFIKTLDTNKIKKIKGIDNESAENVATGCAIINAIFSKFKINEICISTADLRTGILNISYLSQNQEKVADVLSNSLENYAEWNGDEFSMNNLVYEMSIILFKQLKVMHKLPRFYVKPLRIAAYLYDAGKRIDCENYSKHSLETIVNAKINGVSHRELLVAGFIAVCQNLDDFSLNEWIKYKDILTDEDLDAVRKLGIIIKLAVALNASRKPVVKDIVCDILGDSIIMKTIADTTPNFEILEGMKIAPDYKKVYKKSLQII